MSSTEQPEDFTGSHHRVNWMIILDGVWHSSSSEFTPLEKERYAEHILRLCEAAALAALEESRVDGMFIEWNGLNLFDIATAQANIHSVFGGTSNEQ
jgi:hypothetical protein